MKLISSFTLCFLLEFCSCLYSQNNYETMNPEEMLLEFYTNLFYIYENSSITDSSLSNYRSEKYDSLIAIYCTNKLIKEAELISENGYGTEILTNDFLGDLNENILIEKDLKFENTFKVYFDATYFDAPEDLNKKHVTLIVTLIKEAEKYKIAKVQ